MITPANPAAAAKRKVVILYAEQTVTLDGTITIKPLRYVVPEDEIGIEEACKMTGLSRRTLQNKCETGQIPSARKPGGTTNSKWRMSRMDIVKLMEQQEPGK